MDLVYKHEKLLFTISAIISIPFWILVIAVTIGGLLPFLLMVFIFYLFAQSAFVSYVKGTGIKITDNQYSDLHSQYHDCCSKLGIKNAPDIYLLHGNGIFNAMATRFLGRNFVILLSDVVDAFDDEKECLNFYIGHELGHIDRKHLLWNPVLFPARILPVIGPAFSRAREYTCDSYGYNCCNAPDDAIKGLAALAVGGRRWKSIAAESSALQIPETASFWMSFHEFISGYPWLTKRIYRLKNGDMQSDMPRRNILAFILSCFIPGTGVASIAGGNALMAIAIVGILSAIAIPNFLSYRAKSLEDRIQNSVAMLVNAQHYYYSQNNVYSSSIVDLIGVSASEDIELEILSADDKCFVVKGSHAKHLREFWMDCNNQNEWRDVSQ